MAPAAWSCAAAAAFCAAWSWAEALWALARAWSTCWLATAAGLERCRPRKRWYSRLASACTAWAAATFAWAWAAWAWLASIWARAWSKRPWAWPSWADRVAGSMANSGAPAATLWPLVT